MKNRYTITLYALLLSSQLYGQTERLIISLDGGSHYSLLKNSVTEFPSSAEVGYTANLQCKMAISRSFAFGLGLGYSKYNSAISLDSYYSATNVMDDEGDIYEYRLYGSNLQESGSIDIIEIPFLLILQNREHKKFKPYLQIGMKAMLPIQSHFESSSGEIESRGYYSQYNVELSKIPNHGFDLYSLTGESGTLSTKLGYAALMEIGTNISLGNSYLLIAFYGTYGLSSISLQRDILTTDHKYQSLFSASNTMPYSVGIKIGLSIPILVKKVEARLP